EISKETSWGTCWKVGSGRQIPIWNEAWILGAENYKIQKLTANQDIEYVSNLIEQHSNCWKKDLIKHTFNQVNAERILSLPIDQQANRLVWRGEASDDYTALAYIQTIQFGAKSGFLRIEVEGDSLTVIKKLQNNVKDKSKISAYIVNAKRLKSNFVIYKFKHASRQTNRVAHNLSKEGLNEEANTYLVNGLSRSVAMAVEEGRQRRIVGD
ncbi:hypothetical protein Gogos_006014, partial [Gossypium gossypioides]|nr:hypothetical protein [Gossypium gossypioides]